MRRLLVFFFALLVAPTTDFGSLVTGVACVETCPDDDDQGRCPPVCVSCACVGHARADLPRPATVAASADARDLRPFEADAAPSAPHRPDILHVPLLA